MITRRSKVQGLAAWLCVILLLIQSPYILLEAAAQSFVLKEIEIIRSIPPEPPQAGIAMPWQHPPGSDPGANVSAGNKLTEAPIVSWAARGGMKVSMSLFHNSQSSENTVLGPKWRHSYQISLTSQLDGYALTWGNGASYDFSETSPGHYSPPAGIHDSLVRNADSTFTLTTAEQVRYHFDSSLRCDSIMDLNGNTISLHYTGSNVDRITDPTGRALELIYVGGKISEVRDMLGRVWQIGYDGASGNLTSLTHPLLADQAYATTFTYNAQNNITSLQTPRNSVWRFGYFDNSGALSWEEDPLGNRTNYAYYSDSVAVTDPNGNVSRTFYSQGRVTQVQDALLNSEFYQWDENNHLTQITDKRGQAWRFGPDALGRNLWTEDPYYNRTSFTWTSLNRVASTTRPTHEYQVFTYDSNGNLTATRWYDAGGNTRALNTIVYDANGLQTDFYDANGRRTQTAYDAYGQLVSTTTPAGRIQTWEPNLLGAHQASTDAMGRRTQFDLDEWQRRVRVVYPDSTEKTYAYDLDGNLSRITIASGTIEFTRDAANRLTAESVNGVTTVSYSYDAPGKRGLLSTKEDVLGGRTWTYEYTGRNELYQVIEPGLGTASYFYDENGNTVHEVRPNGTATIRSYDDANRMVALTNENSSGEMVSSFGYTRDGNDRIQSVTELDGSTVSYAYDWRGALVEETRTGANPYAITYNLDSAGNRVSQSVNGVQTLFSYSNDDELISTSGGITNTYSYNANGEQMSRTINGVTYALAWDYEGKLVSITQGAHIITYAYDGLDRRSRRTADGLTTDFVFDGANILTERQGGAVSAVYSYGQSLLRRNGDFPYFDALSITRAVGNASEQVTATQNFDAFGQIVGSTGQSSLPFRYGGMVGYRDDGDAGLMHVGARYYDPQVGIFISRDSDLSEHPYQYCEGDPINFVDPTGNARQRPHGKGTGGGGPGQVVKSNTMPRRIPKHIQGGAGKWKWTKVGHNLWKLVPRGAAGVFTLVVLAGYGGAALADVVTEVTRPDPRHVLPDPTMDPGPGAGNLPAYSQGARLGIYGSW